MLIAQISDPHIVAPGALLYRRIDTADALRRAVDRLLGLAPDLVVLSGDLVNRGRPEEYAHLRALLAPLPMPLWPLPGNHDDRAALSAAFPDVAFSGSPLCCSRVDTNDLSLLLLDTVIPGKDGGEIGEAQLAWLDDACPANRPAMLFLHHPPFATGIAGMDAIGLAGADRLATWLSAHRNVVALSCGHVHRSVSTQFAGVAATIAPSPAHQIALEFSGDAQALAWTGEPGGLLLHRWDGGRITTHLCPVDPAPATPYA